MDSGDAKVKYQQASELYAKKDYGAALALLEEMLEALPDNADLQRVHAEVVRAMELGTAAAASADTHRSTVNRKSLLWACTTLCAAFLGVVAVWGLSRCREPSDVPPANEVGADSAGPRKTDTSNLPIPHQRALENEEPSATINATGSPQWSLPSPVLRTREDISAEDSPSLRLQVMPFCSTAFLSWKAASDMEGRGYAILRRSSAGSSEEPHLYVGNRNFVTDFGLTPGEPYSYRVAAIGADGSLGVLSEEVEVSTHLSSKGLSRHSNLQVLVVIYRAGNASLNMPPIDDIELARLKKGLELFRLFYWRNTKCRLNLDFTYLEILDPDNFSDPRERDLIARRLVQPDQYDTVFLIGNDPACWAGGGLILGHATLAVGCKCGVPYPGNDPSVDYQVAWHYTHEFGHNVDGFFAPAAGYPEFPHPDIETAYSQKSPNLHFDAGTHYDWVGNALRQFGDIFDRLPAPWDDYIESQDLDSDGLPDDDFRVPVDENRFGSEITRRDSDEDGLLDLDEFACGIFRGSNPVRKDTDGDGLTDGLDPYPLVRVRDSIPFVIG